MINIFFFFSSRRRHTRYWRDWSSDVCSSDLPIARIWKNSAKWAYIDKSVHTTQAFPAHRSYFAAGAEVTWAVLDSGINWTHPHFGGEKGTLKSVYDCTSRKQRQLPAKDLQPRSEERRVGKE